MKPALSDQKLRGGYYTPKPIADFLARWAIRDASANILEPSCGDGIILESIAKTLITLGASVNDFHSTIHGIEIEAEEIQKAEKRLMKIGVPVSAATFHRGDFFSYCRSHLSDTHKFDVVAGNPPFIRYQNFIEEHRVAAFKLMEAVGLHPNRLTNAWVPFLVASSLLLNEHGRLAMVIPAELFQVNYAAEIRQFLSDFYSKLTLITFKKLLFEGIQQEIVLLLGERNGDDKSGIRTVELESIAALGSYKYRDFNGGDLKPMDHSKEKWTQYFLHTDEILLLRDLRNDRRISKTGDLINVDVGVVTGENRFFVLNKKQLDEYRLGNYVQAIVSRSGHAEGIAFSKEDWEKNIEKGLQTFLFVAPDKPIEKQSKAVKSYINKGEMEHVHKGYKCRIRKRWFVVPSIWNPHVFILRQVHDYPKLILNGAKATSTDTVHRGNFIDLKQKRKIAAAFLNSLTFAFAEVSGRSYGGGVLTFEPSEIESLPIPLVNADNLNFQQIDRLVRKNDIDSVLDMNDEILLKQGLGLSETKITKLRNIWEKLRDRRINRKH